MDHRPLGRRQVYRVQVEYIAAITAGLTHDVTLLIIPAGALVHEVIADTTTQWAGTAGTLFMRVGTTVGGKDLVDEHDVETATLTKGGIIHPNGHLPSFSATTTLTARIRSSSGNVGDGTNTLLSAGVTDFYITTEALQ